MCPHFPFFIRDKYGQCCVARVTISLQRCLQEAVVLHGLECNSLPTCIQIKSICMHVADAYVVILLLTHPPSEVLWTFELYLNSELNPQ